MAESSPAASKPVNLTWIHRDPRGLSQAMKDGVWRARDERWARNAESVADMRAFLLATFAAAASLGPVPPKASALASGPTLGVTVAVPSGREDNRAIQSLLLMAVLPLVGATIADVRRMESTLAPATVETDGGGLPAGPTRDAGALPVVLGGVAIVSFFVGLGGVMAVYFSQRNELDALTVASNERVAKHAASIAAAVGRIESHQEREADAGTTLPWDPVELSWLESLKASTAELAKVPAPALETVPKLGDVTSGVGKAIGDVGEAAKGAVTGAGFGLGAVAAAAGLWWLMQQDNRRRAAA